MRAARSIAVAAAVAAILAPTASTQAKTTKLTTAIAETQVALWRCQDQLGQSRTRASVTPWALPRSVAYRRWTLRRWQARKAVCLTALHRVAEINRNLYRLGSCETGGKPGQNGVPDWDHRARSPHPGHYYEGAFGFLDTTWDGYKPAGYPDGAHQATPGQQYVVGRILIETFGGYSPWPSCHVRLGLPG